MPRTDSRGEVITEWAAEHDLVVKNVGDKRSFERKGYGSILDLIITTVDISKRFDGWKFSDKESLSDHRYVMFNVREKSALPRGQKPEFRGWNTKKIDTEKLCQATNNIAEGEASADTLFKPLTSVCDACMPKKKGPEEVNYNSSGKKCSPGYGQFACRRGGSI